MSYPRNAASPERIAIGAVVQISDGAVQTSGVAVKVIPFGSTEASGTGTVAYSADGVVLYTPVQAETNYTSFVLVASKSGCIPAATTVVTSASATAGKVVVSGLDADSITSSVVAASAVTEIQNGLATQTSVDAIQADTNDIQTRLPAALDGGRIAAALDPATQTKITNIENGVGYSLAILGGACADPQTASETYTITLFGSTFTVDMAGQTSTGTRTAPTLTKS